MSNTKEKRCMFCNSKLNQTFIDLGLSPLANSYIKQENLNQGETNFPLHVYVCEKCYLVQLQEYESPQEIFTDYAYFSSYSEIWLNHAKEYVNDMTQKLNLNKNSQVIEIASNDGYLLQYFTQKGIPVLGIEPAQNIAKVAIAKGIDTISEFFGQALAKQLQTQNKTADLLLGNNVLAHVPDINDFVGGMKTILKPNGVITMEFPHLHNLIQQNQFDTIYHEHFSYLSLYTVQQIFNKHGLKIFDVQELETHGGSLRIFACHSKNSQYDTTHNITNLLKKEQNFGLDQIQTYKNFTSKVQQIKYDLLETLINLKKQNKTIIAYGAPAKGNTLLNYCGIGKEFIDYTVDKSPHKQGMYLPGTQIPILAPEEIQKTKPDYILILPWNIKEEITKQLEYTQKWGAKFILAVPKVEILT